MEQWSIPIALLPGIALLILSTSNFILGLNRELKELTIQPQEKLLIKGKMRQLRVLSYALAGLYASCAFLVLISAMMLYGTENASVNLQLIIKVLHLFSVVSIFMSLTLLTVYSIRAVSFRQRAFRGK
jgi:hypothetical protein